MLRSLVFFLFSAHTLAAPFHTSKSSTQLSQSAIGGQWHYRRATSTMPCYALTHLRLTEPIVPGQVGSTTYNAAFLGAGTSGCVYGLSKAGSDQILAVAKYEPNMGALKREQSSLKQVDQYYGEFEAHGQHFVVMKYISGVLIEETDGYKKSCGPGKASDSACLHFLAAAAGKVTEAHAEVIKKYGVVHADLGPRNVLFAPGFTGEGGHNQAPELIDWGWTRTISPEGVSDRDLMAFAQSLESEYRSDFLKLKVPSEKLITNMLPVPGPNTEVQQGASGSDLSNDLPVVEPQMIREERSGCLGRCTIL